MPVTMSIDHVASPLIFRIILNCLQQGGIGRSMMFIFMAGDASTFCAGAPGEFHTQV